MPKASQPQFGSACLGSFALEMRLKLKLLLRLLLPVIVVAVAVTAASDIVALKADL